MHHILHVRVMGMPLRVVGGVMLGVLLVFGTGYGLGRDRDGIHCSGIYMTPQAAAIMNREFDLHGKHVGLVLGDPVRAGCQGSLRFPVSHVAAYHGKNICDIRPTNIGNITVWNGFTTCSLSK